LYKAYEAGSVEWNNTSLKGRRYW